MIDPLVWKKCGLGPFKLGSTKVCTYLNPIVCKSLNIFFRSFFLSFFCLLTYLVIHNHKLTCATFFFLRSFIFYRLCMNLVHYETIYNIDTGLSLSYFHYLQDFSIENEYKYMILKSFKPKIVRLS